MIAALRKPKHNASGIVMRARLFTFLVAFAVLWCGTGGPALACLVEGPASVVVAVDAIDQFASSPQDESERRSNPPGQSVAHHHCCTATYATEAPFIVSPPLKQAPVAPSPVASLTSFAQAPPVQPPSA